MVLQIVGQIQHLSGDGADGRAGRHADTVCAQPIGVAEQGRGGTAQLDRGQAQRTHRFCLAGARPAAFRPRGEHEPLLSAAIDDAGSRDQQRQGQSEQERETRCHAAELSSVSERNG